MASYVCQNCGKEFEKNSWAKFCSDKCRDMAYVEKRRQRSRTAQHERAGTPIVPRVGDKYQKICICCGNTFLADDYRARVCSDECRKSRKRIVKAESYERHKHHPKNVSTITEVTVEGRKLGLSYGKMMVRLSNGNT